MGDWGFKISQEGFDVFDAAAKDLVASSSFNLLKTASVGTGASTTVAHGLAYTPFIFTTQLVAGKQSIIGDDYLTTVDATNVNLVSASTTKYYIFYQDIE